MSYNFTRFAPILCPMPIFLNRLARATLARTLLLTTLLLGACATQPPVTPLPPAPGPGAPVAPAPAPAPPPPPPKPQTAPTTSTKPPSNVNLQGFPLPYRQGYTDGCASVGATEQKDAARFKSDGQYRTGWQDGVFLCKKK
jgi:hypothetical protein